MSEEYRGEIEVGLLTVPFGRTPFKKIAETAGAEGFKTLSIAAWPPPEISDSGRTGEDAFVSPHCGDLRTFDEARASEMRGAMKEAGVRPHSMAYFVNMSTANETQRREFIENYGHVCRIGAMLGAEFVGTFPGRNETMTEEGSLRFFLKEVDPELTARAKGEGRKKLLENCIMEGLLAEYGLTVGNVAYCPENFRTILDKSEWYICLDPSHMVWQGIDYLQALKEFRDAIAEVHGKDAMVLDPRFRPPETRNLNPLEFRKEWYDKGIVRDGHPVKAWGAGLYKHAVPGCGDVHWGNVVRVMRESGLVVPIDLEIEDEAYDPRSPKPEKNHSLAAFRVGLRALRPYCVALD